MIQPIQKINSRQRPSVVGSRFSKRESVTQFGLTPAENSRISQNEKSRASMVRQSVGGVGGLPGPTRTTFQKVDTSETEVPPMRSTFQKVDASETEVPPLRPTFQKVDTSETEVPPIQEFETDEVMNMTDILGSLNEEDDEVLSSEKNDVEERQASSSSMPASANPVLPFDLKSKDSRAANSP